MILGSGGRLEVCRGCRPEIPKNLEVGGRRREVGSTQKDIAGRRRGAGIWRRKAGDVAQGAPQRALCDVWRREVGIRNLVEGRKYEFGGGTWDMGISRIEVGGGRQKEDEGAKRQKGGGREEGGGGGGGAGERMR